MHCAALDKLSFVSTTKYVLYQVFSWKCTFDFPSTVVIVSQELVRRIVQYSLTILQPLCSSIIIDLIDTPQGPLLNIRICLKIARILNINAVELKLFRWKTQSAYTNHTPEPFYLETRTKPGEQHTAADEASLSQSVSLRPRRRVTLTEKRDPAPSAFGVCVQLLHVVSTTGRMWASCTRKCTPYHKHTPYFTITGQVHMFAVYRFSLHISLHFGLFWNMF